MLGNTGGNTKASMVDKVARIVNEFDIMPIYFTLVIDTKEADNPTDNKMCQEILMNVVFDWASELWKLRSGVKRDSRTASIFSRPQTSARKMSASNILLLSTG